MTLARPGVIPVTPGAGDTPLPLGEGVAASAERAGMAGGQAYYGHKYKSRYVDIQRLSSAEAGLGRAWHPPLTMI